MKGSIFGRALLPIYTILALLFLLIPIVYTFIFSFNDAFKTNIQWQGFTWHNWTNVCDAQGVCEAFGNSIIVGVVATLAATALGTALAIALVRYKFRGRNIVSLLIFLPMATPEVVLGAGLAAQFFSLGTPKGMLTVIIAHTIAGRGVPDIEGDFHWHGKPPTREEGKKFLQEIRSMGGKVKNEYA